MENAQPVRAPFYALTQIESVKSRLKLPSGLLLLPLMALAVTVGCGEPDPVIETSDGSTMILIPAGVFQRGGKEEEVAEAPDRNFLTYVAERPVSDITLNAFYIDKYEVTNAQYREFLDDAGMTNTRWDHTDQPEQVHHGPRHITDDQKGDDQPAAGINWYDAYAYCAWADKRLPTEAEWEYAARGGTYRKYPWGEHPPYHDGVYFANFRPEHNADADGHKVTAPVGTYPDGVSPFGVMDMAGNAEEWVHDWYDHSYYQSSKNSSNPTGPAAGVQRVIKGGSYGTPRWEVRIAQRFKGKPHNKGPRIGFRCALDP